MQISHIIAKELNVKETQVSAAITLLDEGATVPFISRYRKEATGGLTDTDLRMLEERLHYLREFSARRETILKSIEEQGKLTDELKSSIMTAEDKSTLEDLYLPFKPKRRTKAQIAREAGLEPLAMQLLADPTLDPQVLAETFLNPDHHINTVKEALDGAKQILMEYFSESAPLLSDLREYVWQHAMVKSTVNKGKESDGVKFKDYFDYSETIKTIPSHRALALLRGQREEMLSVNLVLTEDQQDACLQKIAAAFNVRNAKRAADSWLQEVVSWTFKIKLFLKCELELMMRLREAAEAEAIKVFSTNLKHLLLASPAGAKVTMGLDPGFRTGVKVVVIDETGKLLSHTVIYPHEPQNEWKASLTVLQKLCEHFGVSLISIGNGTASRETDKLATELKSAHPTLKLTSLVVSESGASVYSASSEAAKEFPNLDVTYRGAVSIARRLQDPLAELVKIDPKAIGVGQYQHDVNQTKLSRTLQAVMEDCVNAVGVNVNTASPPLLACVAGLSAAVAERIVAHRDAHGAFHNRLALKKVPRLGEKAFEQAAGFLRIVDGDNPLDASAVHPEAYVLVEKMLKKQQKTIKDIMGNIQLLSQIKPKEFVDEQFGLPTVVDIIHELEKPGRDPRPEFKTAVFKEGIEKLSDLKTGMILEGVVTNVANFGAFVDVGVHQDGLVHVSMLANKFVKDPNEVVKVGDIVKVKVLEVDVARKRIQLSMRLDESAVKKTESQPQHKKMNLSAPAKSDSVFGDALRDAFKR